MKKVLLFSKMEIQVKTHIKSQKSHKEQSSRKGLETIIAEQCVEWDKEYTSHVSKIIDERLSLNNSLILHYKNQKLKNSKVKLPFLKRTNIDLPPSLKRPKCRIPISVPRSIRTTDNEVLSFIPHFDSLKEYCEIEEKMPEIRKLYKQVSIPSYIRKSKKGFIPESQYNDFILTKFVANFGFETQTLSMLALLLGKDLGAVCNYLASLQMRLTKFRIGIESKKNSIETIGKYNKQAFCNICFVYCCSLHMPNTNAKYSLDLNDIDWPSLKIIGAGKKTAEIQTLLKNLNNKRLSLHYSKAESTKYLCKSKASCAKSESIPTDLNALTQGDLHILLESLKLGVYNSCFLAFLLNDDKKCHAVRDYLSANMYLLSEQNTAKMELTVESLRSLHSGTYFYKIPPALVSYTPCNHKGLCTAENNCLCFKKRGYCEKQCICKEFCGRQFPGCDCKQSISCNGKGCKCLLNGRECDPDLCNCCLNPELKCQNMEISLNKQKKIIIGSSLICIGYGLFAAEPIQKGQYICEYLGEIISKEEGERRGMLNEISGCTYLFDLTDETFIDACTLGGKMRYANHASHGMENAITKMIYINAIPRIALYALQDIEKYEEILFNYRIRKPLKWVADYEIKYQINKSDSMIEEELDQPK